MTYLPPGIALLRGSVQHVNWGTQTFRPWQGPAPADQGLGLATPRPLTFIWLISRHKSLRLGSCYPPHSDEKLES
jgi:hypothetical protein